jgi:hypothetical protein
MTALCQQVLGRPPARRPRGARLACEADRRDNRGVQSYILGKRVYGSKIGSDRVGLASEARSRIDEQALVRGSGP